MVAVGALAASTGWAQTPRVEVGGTAGWTTSDGVTGGPVVVPGFGSFDEAGPKDAFSWGLRFGVMVTPNVEVGALFNQQKTQLELIGTSTVELGDQSVNNYHGYVAYNFGDEDASVRPYFLGGLGATQYGSISASIGNLSREIDGNTKFSTTWAVGVKLNAGSNLGLRLEGRWTPTYIKSDAVGWWCDPYWGCYTVGDAQYANQFELSGGIHFRF
jgi:opacity protein-like surface antigen